MLEAIQMDLGPALAMVGLDVMPDHPMLAAVQDTGEFLAINPPAGEILSFREVPGELVGPLDGWIASLLPDPAPAAAPEAASVRPGGLNNISYSIDMDAFEFLAATDSADHAVAVSDGSGESDAVSSPLRGVRLGALSDTMDDRYSARLRLR